jgi:hypothetical protein
MCPAVATERATRVYMIDNDYTELTTLNFRRSTDAPYPNTPHTPTTRRTDKRPTARKMLGVT